MKSKTLENKIKKSTKSKDYNKAMDTLVKYYIKLFKKMLKYKKVKFEKTWYLYDYINVLKEKYKLLFEKDLEEMSNVLYSEKYPIKYQINWLLDNYDVFRDYKI